MAAAVARAAPRRTSDGVIGVVFTPSGRLVLVRHTYVRGWYPPGGGRKRGETPRDAVLRELREEIGLSSWSSVEPFSLDEDSVAAFVLRDALYRSKANLEIEAVCEFDAGSLPQDTSPRLIAIVAALGRDHSGMAPQTLDSAGSAAAGVIP